MKRKRAQPKTAKAKGAPALSADALFDVYKSSDDVIDPEGVERFCGDLELEPSDRRVLVLAWCMGAARMGFFTRPEFQRGFGALGSPKSLQHVKQAVASLDARIQAPSTFAAFFTFAFQFCLTEPGQKIIDVATAAQMLEVVLPGGRFVPAFATFLREQTDYRKVNLDQWNSFLAFSQEVAEDMSNAGDNPARPLLLDNFVDWWQRRQEQGGSAEHEAGAAAQEEKERQAEEEKERQELEEQQQKREAEEQQQQLKQAADKKHKQAADKKHKQKQAADKKQKQVADKKRRQAEEQQEEAASVGDSGAAEVKGKVEAPPARRTRAATAGRATTTTPTTTRAATTTRGGKGKRGGKKR